MRVIRGITIFLLALLIVILVGVLVSVAGYYYAPLLPNAHGWAGIIGALFGFVIGAIGGMFLSLRFVEYFREKIWPIEKKNTTQV